MDDFNAIRALNLQFEMQKAGSTHGTGSFFRVIFNFSARKIFPAALADAAFYIMEVTIKIKNEENETGKLQIADWALIGKNDDFIAYLDQQLLMDTDERVDSILSSISTASGKEIEIKLPYPLIYMDKEKEIDRNMPYKIAVTKYPSRKYIQFG